MFDINGSKTKLDQESLFSTDHIEYWKCNILFWENTGHFQLHIITGGNLIEMSNLQGFK